MNNNNQQPTMGEFMQKSNKGGAKSIVVAVLVSFLLIGVVYTGIHNFNLFSRTLGDDQKIFALIPVVLLEGGILLFLAGSFVWFAGGAQKIVATISGWLLFAIVAANTVVDSLLHSSGDMPSWLTLYSTFVMYAMPVLVMAILKLILDLDPAKRRMDMEKAIEFALMEGKFAAAQRAMNSEPNRAALSDYGDAYGDALAAHIRQSAPQVPTTPTRPALPKGEPVKGRDYDTTGVVVMAKDGDAGEPLPPARNIGDPK